MTRKAPPPAIIWPFIAWLLLFYGAWLALVIYGDYIGTVLAHWPMAVAMALAS